LNPAARLRNYQKPAILFALASLALAFIFPMVTDEAYYVDWASRGNWPSLGFFDHPPLVSWLGSFVRIWHHVAAARIVVWLINLLSLWAVWCTCAKLIPNRSMQAVVILATSIGGITAGILLTPDTGLIALWNIAIHEAVCAVRGKPKRWITAGVATGLGLLSKYTMVLIGPVFLWGLIRDNRRQLRSLWPYLGALTCLLIFLPHLWWQSENQWITFKFQFGHGFSVRQSLDLGSVLPLANEPGSPSAWEWKLRDQLFAALSGKAGFDEVLKKPKPEVSQLARTIQYTGDFLGGVAGLWGVYAFALIFALLTRKPNTPSIERPLGMAVIEGSAFFPLLFFGMIAPFSKIEANWPAMHMAALAVWFCWRCEITWRVIKTAVIIHLAAILLLAVVMTWPGSLPSARRNRLLLESKGYQALGFYVGKRFHDTPIAVDSYQLKSAIRYYAAYTPVAQWPGITRGSEYTRGVFDDKTVEQRLLAQAELAIISLQPSPRIIDGYKAVKFEGLRVCPDGSLGAFSVDEPILPCEKGLREWWVTTYRSTR
jgi:4-amino-4-deoxy-L-arabinose transferase-like glycosyltransferase